MSDTLKELVVEKLRLTQRLKELESEIYNVVVSTHAKHKVNDVVDHVYRGGGKMVIDEVVVNTFDQSDSRGYFSFMVSYQGRAINKNGEIGKMKVSNFNSQQPRLLVKLDERNN